MFLLFSSTRNSCKGISAISVARFRLMIFLLKASMAVASFTSRSVMVSGTLTCMVFMTTHVLLSLGVYYSLSFTL